MISRGTFNKNYLEYAVNNITNLHSPRISSQFKIYKKQKHKIVTLQK